VSKITYLIILIFLSSVLQKGQSQCDKIGFPFYFFVFNCCIELQVWRIALFESISLVHSIISSLVQVKRSKSVFSKSPRVPFLFFVHFSLHSQFYFPLPTNIHYNISVLYRAHLCMKCSFGISDFLEEISSLSHSVVFLYFFALIAEEGFLISSCYSLELCIQMFISFLFSFAFHFSSFNLYGEYIMRNAVTNMCKFHTL